MADEVKILYDGKDVFEGISPTPFVSISEEYIDFGTQWNQISNLKLEGQLTGQYLGGASYNYMYDAVQKLCSGFANNYKTIQITEGGAEVYRGDVAVVNSISIADSAWYGILPYSVELSIYNEDLFIDYYGIADPEETFSFSEEDGKIISLTHSVSARGNTNDQNGITNAKEWVMTRTGNVNTVSPIFIKNNDRPFLLQTIKETVDRFNGVYSWEASYKKSAFTEDPNNCLLNYTIDLNSGIDDGFVTADINGTLQSNSLSVLRQEYKKLNLFNICSMGCEDVFKTALSSRPIQQNVDESPDENQINFKSSYNNDFGADVINDYSVDISEDSLKCVRNVSFRATISCKYGDLASRWDKVQAFYRTQFKPFSLARGEFVKEYSTSLRETPLGESITFDQFNAQITYSAQYTDKKRSSFSNDIINLSSSVTLNPAIDIHAPHTSAFTARAHNIQFLGCAKRASLEISVTAVAKMNKTSSFAETEAQREVNRVKINFLKGANTLLEQRSVTRNEDLKSVTISETWTYDGEVVT